MKAQSRIVIRIVLLAAIANLTLIAACGRDDALESDQAAGGSANSSSVPAEGTPSSTTAPGGMTVTSDWQEITKGLPAIQPVLPIQAGVPSFTEQSVKDYIDAHPPREADTSQPVTVKRVEFLPIEVVEERINHPISVPRESLLCLVALNGKWILPARFNDVGTPDPNAVMYLIFDAVTGNYIAKTSGIESD